jgi:fumarylacetoacetase
MMPIDATHDQSRRSWVESANAPETDFPIQNLPLGIFSLNGGPRRPGVAIGTSILDLRALAAAALLPEDLRLLLMGEELDALLAGGVDCVGRLRSFVGDVLDARGEPRIRASVPQNALVPMKEAQMHVPSSVRSFTDFFAGIHHAEEFGRILTGRPELPRSYTAMPLGYNGRASSVRVSGEAVRRQRLAGLRAGARHVCGRNQCVRYIRADR